MGLRSLLRRLGQRIYGRFFGDPGGVTADRHALIDIDLDRRSGQPEGAEPAGGDEWGDEREGAAPKG